MKKQILTLLFSIIIFSSLFAQLNPANNLDWDHWYECPNNFFRLTWDIPDASIDTLIGYNIYRSNELYRFQTETILNHEGGGAGNCSEDFVYYGNGGDFWVHVTAVYNSALRESNYIDSAYCMGYAINTVNLSKSNLSIFPNPTSGKIIVDTPDNIQKILILNQSGKIVIEYENETILDLSHLAKGIYFAKVISKEDSYTEKIILE